MAKAVIFDIGGVLIDWQPRYLFEAHFPDDAPAMRAFFAEVLREIALRTCEAPFAEVMPAAKARRSHKRSIRPPPPTPLSPATRRMG